MSYEKYPKPCFLCQYCLKWLQLRNNLQALSENFSCRRCHGEKLRKADFELSGFKKRRAPGTASNIWRYQLLCPYCPKNPENWRREDHAKLYRC